MHLMHIPTPGDHYSEITGSATMTVIYELSRVHAARGGSTDVVVGRDTVHDYPAGSAVETEFPGLPSRWQKMLDAGFGRTGLRRHFVERTYMPALKVIPREFPGALVLHNSAGALPLFARSRPAARTCLYAHNTLFKTFGRRESQRVLSQVDRVICVSDYLAEDLHSHAGRRLSNVTVVLNGVDTDRFRPCSSPTSATPTILFLGRVVPEKGAHLLLAAATRIASARRGFRIRIVGSSGFSSRDPLSAYERHLRELASPIADRVDFQPFTDRRSVVNEYQRASIACVPSDWDDPCPLTLLEALACGLPVVASRRGGMPQAGGDAVLWFTPPDVDALCEHLLTLLDHPEERNVWGDRARRRALDLSWANQYESFRSALSDLG